jgi:hypothetical protein
VLPAEADDAAVEIVDLRRPPRLDVLQHRRPVVVRDVLARRVVDQLLGIGVELDPLRRGDGLALVDEAGDERAEVGALADPAVREPGQRADRVRRGVEDHLPPLRATRVLDGVGRHPGARAGVGQALDLRERGAPVVGAERRVALHVPLHVPRLEEPARGERRAPDDALDVPRERLLVAEAVLDGGDAAAGEGVRRRRDRGFRVHRLRRHDAEVARRQLGGVARRAGVPDDVVRPREPQAVALDRVHVRLREVVRPDLDVVEQRQVRREQRPHRPASHDRDPHSE